MSRFVERLRSEHDRRAFSCGQRDVDDWFHQIAGQAERRHGSARVHVLVDEDIDNARTPIGFYALTAHAVTFEEAPGPVRRGHPQRLTIGAALLGQLAVDLRYQGQGIGAMLLADVVRGGLRADRDVAVPLLVVDAVDEQTAGWYEQRGFARFSDDALRLAVRLVDARRTFAPSTAPPAGDGTVP